MEDQDKFTYSYSVPTQEERKQIERIREKYQPRSTAQDRLARIRALDKKITSVPSVFALTLGVLGTLVFGTGLSCILVWDRLILGIVLGFLGIVPISLAAPVYHRKHKQLKDKYAPEILQLSEELLSDHNNTLLS